MGNGVTELVMILDRSGSMADLMDDTIGGFNSVLEEQREKGGKILVTTVLFNQSHTIVHDRLPIDKVPAMTRAEYRPSGCTALMDCLGSTIRHIETIHRYSREEDLPQHTLFIITTDGLENASRNFSSDEVKKLVEQKRELGWEFIYLAANIDAVETAKDIGIARERAVNYHNDRQGTAKKFAAMNRVVRASVECPADMDLRKCFKTTNWREELDEDYITRKGK